MNKARMILLASAVIIEIAGVILIAKAILTDSSVTQGVVSLAIGLVFLVIGLRRKSKDVKPDAS